VVETGEADPASRRPASRRRGLRRTDSSSCARRAENRPAPRVAGVFGGL